MKWLIPLTLAFLFTLTTNTYAQPPVVGNGTQVTWDYDTAAEGVETFRVYGAKIPGVVPSGTTFLGEVAFPTLLWTILTPSPGKWYLVVTASNATYSVESGPSNELELVVIGKPSNLRIAALLTARIGIG
jgi:hypothetical protein